ncbi:MAG: DNRLRE domain-containing protein [Bacteroidetes bacterium]|nr:DNRLRE domain-containing protein [Bacteroidota bacterium]MBL6944427.1 DNRLRE domain-containing protein [Bacteroidales bacterium]
MESLVPGGSLIGFDFSDLREDIVVIDARLNLYHNPTSGHEGHSTLGGDNTGVIFRITEQWKEDSVTWINQPATTNTNFVIISAPDNDTADFLNVDITPIIKDMIRHPATNDGFMIKLFSEDTLYRSLVFASSDHPVESLHPSISITYIVDLPVDSVLTLQPDGETGKDAYINSIVSTSKNNQQSLVSTVWEFEEGWGIGRSFINFDLSHIDPELTITLAELSLFHDPDSPVEGHINNGNSNEILISRIIESWSEDDINWDNQPATSPENQVLLPSSNLADQDYLDIYVTEIVTDMFNYMNESFGFMLQLSDETFGNYNRNVVFASSDHQVPELRPKLVIYTQDYTSLKEPDNTVNNMLVYPNPGAGDFNIQVSKNIFPVQYTVYDSFGNVIVASNTLNSKFYVDITSQPSGVYFLSVIIKNSVTTKKLIKL